MLWLALLGVLGYKLLHHLPPLQMASSPIRYVRVEGYFQYLTKKDLQDVLQPQLAAGFWEANVQSIRQAISTLPWIESVSVTRIWPDTIAIQVIEKMAYSRWGEKSLITENGDVFTPNDMTPFLGLTLVDGPKQQQLKVLETMQGIKTTLADQSMSLTEFRINGRGAWRIKLANGLAIQLGRAEQLKKLHRFLKSLTKLEPSKIAAMATVDLRYPNGYAVVWKPGTQIAVVNTSNPHEGLATP